MTRAWPCSCWERLGPAPPPCLLHATLEWSRPPHPDQQALTVAWRSSRAVCPGGAEAVFTGDVPGATTARRRAVVHIRSHRQVPAALDDLAQLVTTAWCRRLLWSRRSRATGCGAGPWFGRGALEGKGGETEWCGGGTLVYFVALAERLLRALPFAGGALDPAISKPCDGPVRDAGSGFAGVTLPLIMPGIVAAAMLAFALSFELHHHQLRRWPGQTVTFPMYVWGAAQRWPARHR